jgi:hypothetical protein
LEEFGRTIEQADIPHLERIAALLIQQKMVVDLETKQVEAEFALPSWLGGLLAENGSVGLAEALAYKTLHEAHPESRVILAIFHCDIEGKPLCYTCQRLKSAA